MTENRPLLNSTGHWHVPDNLDTDDFDFDWRPDPYERPYRHQFGTQWQKTGGPCYIVDTSTDVMYQSEQRAIRLPSKEHWQINEAIDEARFDWSWHPDETEQAFNHVFGNKYFTARQSHSVVYQRPGATEFKYEVAQRATQLQPLLDIVFISNGETGAEERYTHLCKIAGRTVKRVSNVSGREHALRAAAELASTDWFFAVPAKLRVDAKFDFKWQPNRCIEAKHWIFTAKNPVNGLDYGHQALVAYHRTNLLNTQDYGLDFTMSAPHDVYPRCSGIAEYNSDALMTWRTAFREAVKLKAAGDDESLQRLQTWLTVANGEYAEESKQGAQSGVDYYDEVAGDHAKLMLSFKWSWLDQRYKQLNQNA